MWSEHFYASFEGNEGSTESRLVRSGSPEPNAGRDDEELRHVRSGSCSRDSATAGLHAVAAPPGPEGVKR